MNINDFKVSDRYNVSLGDLVRYLLKPSDYKKNIKKKEKSNGAVLSAALCGLAAGFTAALLLTPESGKKLRGEVGETLKVAGKRICDFTEEEAKKVKAYVNDKN